MRLLHAFLLGATTTVVSSAALPEDGGLLREPLEGYTIVPMQWSGTVDGEDMNLEGTIEEVFAQIQAVKPDFDWTNTTELTEPEADLSTLDARSPSNIICDVGGRGPMVQEASMQRETDYLRRIANSQCGVAAGPRVCARVSCSSGDGIWLCNDTTSHLSRRCGIIPDYVWRIFGRCKSWVSSGVCPIRGCQYPEPGWYYARGQQFDTENFNVIIGKDNC
ncbi:hypothetical protein CkaCkLH20_02180 [Colletotrichum karsti]|uniref:Secreted protein n=1 Tax=Colletotrichum karsti TaxID=1095194 RepID=A0A9P6IE60_9PEZI|nr:uncharacterized protein CkaCkLH20_02180 [Colletotrichum karsti]KAF9880226.1 hypothetical protein CkaCkLH20_02180 [Colletotrichum karsti]